MFGSAAPRQKGQCSRLRHPVSLVTASVELLVDPSNLNGIDAWYWLTPRPRNWTCRAEPPVGERDPRAKASRTAQCVSQKVLPQPSKRLKSDWILELTRILYSPASWRLTPSCPPSGSPGWQCQVRAVAQKGRSARARPVGNADEMIYRESIALVDNNCIPSCLDDVHSQAVEELNASVAPGLSHQDVSD